MMMAITALLSGLLGGPACTPKATNQAPTDSATTDDGDPHQCTDCDGWNTWVDEIEAHLVATGKCPMAPPKMVAKPDGTMVAADPHVVDVSNSLSWFRYTVHLKSTWLEMHVREGHDDKACNSIFLFFDPPKPGMLDLEIWSNLHEPITPPVVFRTIPGDIEDDLISGYMSYRTIEEFPSPHGSEGGMTLDGAYLGSYMWLCIESVETPSDDFAVGPGVVHGSMFFHTERWLKPRRKWYQQDGPPTDVFVPLGAVDCTWPEDASLLGDDPPYYCQHWGSQCDGVDNDMDGEIDEGQMQRVYPLYPPDGNPAGLDNDRNGVPDCMDDWDRDLIPNTWDPDVNACCYDYKYGICY